MPIRRRRPHLAWLRTLLLLALLAVVVGVVGLFLFGRAGKRQEPPQVAEEAGLATEGTTLIGRDFDYTYTEGERPLFRIRGQSIRADREDTLYLDGVALTLYDPEGRAYHAESRIASFSRARNEGELSGKVRLQGPDGVDFRSEVLQIVDKGRVLIAPKPVQIGFLGKYVARAETLQFHLERELYMLVGKVVVRSVAGIQPPVLLRSGHLEYDRPRRQLKVEGIEQKAALIRGEDQLQAARINAFLTPDEGSLTLVRAIFQVTGRAMADVEGEGRTLVRFNADDLTVLIPPGAPGAPSQPRQVELDSEKRGGVVLRALGGGFSRVLTAKRVVGRMGNGALQTASAFRGVEVRESAGRGGPERVVSGEYAEVSFQPDGQIARVNLNGQVHYSDPEVNATGQRGTMDFASQRGEFFGTPVDVRSKRGRLLAPHAVYTSGNGLLHADGGVRATMEQEREAGGTLSASLPGQEEGPVRVESSEAFWRDKPRSFLFRGNVRAWQGESLLTAADLRGDEEGTGAGKVTASGGVKSLWIPRAQPAEAVQPAASRAEAPRKPIEVTAAQLVYNRPPGGAEDQGLLTYSGDVKVEQEGRTLLCRELVVELGEENRAETMTCTGSVRISDPAGGRDVEGERAVYHVAERRIEVFGDPVTMRDRDGNQVRGRRLIYYLDDARVEVKGQAEAAPPEPAAAPPPGSGGGRGGGT